MLHTIRYDTVYLRELKSWREGQLNLAHGKLKTKNKEKLKTTKTDDSSEETVWVIVRESSPGVEVQIHAHVHVYSPRMALYAMCYNNRQDKPGYKLLQPTEKGETQVTNTV